MHIQHSIIQLAGHSLQRVDFDPLTLQPEDLLWLPHHARLSGCVRKRQSEHLAGRIAAVYALREVGEKEVPAIGDQRQPLWRNWKAASSIARKKDGWTPAACRLSWR